MKLQYDPEADAVYIYLREDVRFSFNFNLDDGRIISYGPDSKPIGVELLGVSQGVDLTDDVYGCGQSERLLRRALATAAAELKQVDAARGEKYVDPGSGARDTILLDGTILYRVRVQHVMAWMYGNMAVRTDRRFNGPQRAREGAREC
jgi:uncharacterized protein YuzE